ncbi:hypothetical protein K1T71_005120 [Dendrolimus kikuchii]|uniref:Uncharacterized protein n=1 Tax=Dendrolimus kikuchii TaxID=765133 RepID=A0ACC1D661_9NEOP|nr:hypothetical protein K1T71_005120 [Dendrolimus kikuchii]
MKRVQRGASSPRIDRVALAHTPPPLALVIGASFHACATLSLSMNLESGDALSLSLDSWECTLADVHAFEWYTRSVNMNSFAPFSLVGESATLPEYKDRRLLMQGDACAVTDSRRGLSTRPLTIPHLPASLPPRHVRHCAGAYLP